MEVTDLVKGKGASLAPAPVKKKKGILWELRTHWVLFLMLLPAIVFFIIFHYIPMAGVYIAFVDFKIGKGIFGSTFVGMKNFEFLAKTGKLWMITKNTILYNLAFIGIGNIVQMAMAIMLAEIHNTAFKRVTQSVLLFPNFISYVIVGVFAYNMFNSDYGFINTLIVGLGGQRYSFYSDPGIWKYIIVIFKLWHDTGYGMIVYLAAITGFDSSLYEAAKIDGATQWQRIRSITLPLLRPTFVLLLLFSLGGIMRGAFDLFYNLIGTNSILYPQTDIIDTYVYRSLLGQTNFSQSAAVGVYQSVFGLIIVTLVNFVVKKLEPDYALF